MRWISVGSVAVVVAVSASAESNHSCRRSLRSLGTVVPGCVCRRTSSYSHKRWDCVLSTWATPPGTTQAAGR